MKPNTLFVLNRNLVWKATEANPFRLAGSASLSPFTSVKPINLEAVRPALEGGSSAANSSEGIRPGTKTETILLWLAGAALLGTLMLCGLGAQHVAHNREKAAWSRLLQQKETELAQMTQACRVMENLVATRAPQDWQQPAVLPAVARHQFRSPGSGAMRGQTIAYLHPAQKSGKTAPPQSRPVTLAKATKSKSGVRS